MKYSHLCSLALGIMMIGASCARQANNTGATSETRVSGSIDQQIAQLQEQRRIYLVRAGYFQREADRVFTQDWVAYKLYLQQQEHYQDLADETDQQIKALQAKR